MMVNVASAANLMPESMDFFSPIKMHVDSDDEDSISVGPLVYERFANRKLIPTSKALIDEGSTFL
jgi:hypothetical protein